MGKEEIQESEPLRIYLNEIGEIPLLDETEEKELGRRISDGDESARARLEEGNLRLVVSIATSSRKSLLMCGTKTPQNGSEQTLKIILKRTATA